MAYLWQTLICAAGRLHSAVVAGSLRCQQRSGSRITMVGKAPAGLGG
ncbi:hypothetical protein EDD91_7358 [Streptomyces sp. KS 21]|nr:hypothetical protein EDD91_7358 [Streptomyces sp. KS 21]